MAKKNWREEGVPFHKAENSYHPYHPVWGTELVPTPEPFWATLRVTELERGMRSATVWMTCVNSDIRYPMFVSDFVPMVRDVESDCAGEYTCEWTFVKRGQNYGIVPCDTL